MSETSAALTLNFSLRLTSCYLVSGVSALVIDERVFVTCRTVWTLWRTLLEETDKLAKAKLAAVEIFQQQIADDAKSVRQNKMQLAKKVSYALDTS